VVGQTHPQHLKYLKRKFGRDVYREKLLKIADELDIRKHVRFVNKYVSLNKVISYIGASDFYITPYLDSQQAASGSLAYAIGAGKLCISTPYLYAKEMLSEGRGILVPFENSQKIADAIIRSYRSPKEKERKEYKAYEKGRTMTWANVGHLYFHLFQQTVSKNQ
jgi:glycosyltransferase involved in cell wall biosynthesis